MVTEITEDAISTVGGITGVTTDQATRLLRSNNGNAEQAINAYFENPDVLQAPEEEKWEAPSGLIPGYDYPSYQNQDVPTFQIDATDSGETQNITGAPPSRPNSRMSHRSHRDTIDLTPEHTAGEISRHNPKRRRIKLNLPEKADHSKSMSAQQRYEYDMNRAINESLGKPDSDTQETGVITAPAQQFGPANRDYYSETAWALTTTNTTTQEIVLQPEPHDRIRVAGEPVFLRPSEQTGYLSALLTILHAIPLAREALLSRSQTSDDYGHDPEWWNGTPITLSKIVSMDDGHWRNTEGSFAQNSNIEEGSFSDILKELQRLMAFLDLTKRAYGSADVLTMYEKIRGVGDPIFTVPHFLEAWCTSVEAPIQEIFASEAMKRNPIDGELYEESCLLLDLPIKPKHGQTLYDVVDGIIWDDQPGQDLDEIFFERSAYVFTMRLTVVGSSERGVDVKIPATWYAGRYYKDHLEDAATMRRLKVDVKKEIERIDEMTENYSNFRSAPGEVMGVKGLLESAMTTIEKSFSDQQLNGISEDHDMGIDPVVSNAEILRAVEELKAVTDKVDKKLESLQKRREEAMESLQRLTKSLTDTCSQDEPPRSVYTLRGVSTKPHITYVLRRAEVGDESSTDTIDNEWQWWRISFSRDDASKPSQDVTKSEAPAPEKRESMGWGVPVGPVSEWQKAKTKEKPRGREHLGYTITKVREVEVLKAAREENDSVLLVYASEPAMRHSENQPEYALTEFVKTDNEAFEADLATDDSMPALESSASSPSSPSKRKRAVESSSDYTTNGVDVSQHLDSVFDPKPGSTTGGYDDRVPTSLMDTEMSEMQTVHIADSPPAQEMQEKNGGGLLTSRAPPSRFGRSSQGSMDRIGEEAGEDDMEISHVEFAGE